MKISADRIEILLARKKLTLSELAERSGISRQNISTIKLRGTCAPRTAARIADGLGVDVTEILGGDIVNV